jgi:hypothetical protein
MTSYEVGILVHLLGALLFFGGALVAGVVFEAARRRERPIEVALLLGVTRIGALLVVLGGSSRSAGGSGSPARSSSSGRRGSSYRWGCSSSLSSSAGSADSARSARAVWRGVSPRTGIG